MYRRISVAAAVAALPLLSTALATSSASASKAASTYCEPVSLSVEVARPLTRPDNFECYGKGFSTPTYLNGPAWKTYAVGNAKGTADTDPENNGRYNVKVTLAESGRHHCAAAKFPGGGRRAAGTYSSRIRITGKRFGDRTVTLACFYVSLGN